MLSRCAPFTNRVQYAEGVLGTPVGVYALVESLCGRVVRVELTHPDEQIYTDHDGREAKATSQNIREIVDNYFLLYPGRVVKRVRVVVTAAGMEVGEDIQCPPLNPELIATVARKLLKGMYASRH